MATRSAPVPFSEQIALLQHLIADQQRACLAHDRHSTHSPELAEARWRKLRVLRSLRLAVERWNAVLTLKSQLADIIITHHPDLNSDAQEDAHAADH